MENETKNTWGGRRENTGGKRDGAGRKPTGLPTVKNRGVSFTDDDWNKIKTLAAGQGMSVPKFIMTLVEKHEAQLLNDK